MWAPLLMHKATGLLLPTWGKLTSINHFTKKNNIYKNIYVFWKNLRAWLEKNCLQNRVKPTIELLVSRISDSSEYATLSASSYSWRSIRKFRFFWENGVQQSGERKWGRFNFLNVGIGGHKEKRKNKGFLILKFGGIILLYVVGKAFCLNYWNLL